MIVLRQFRAGDGAQLVEAWRHSAPRDPITPQRFRDLVLLDANFDPAGLYVACDGDRLVGAAYAVRRQVAMVGADLEPDAGWIPFFFVTPAHRRRGTGSALLRAALDWLHGHGRTRVEFSSYTPNYILPGLDDVAYPEALRLLAAHGFGTRYRAAAMDCSLVDYALPDDVAARAAELRAAGYRFGTPADDELPDLVRLAGEEFNPDWARAIRDCITAGTPTERIVVAREPDGTLIGWAMHGAYENVVERFGPFGVLENRRGTGLGKVLLHLTLERMRALGAHSAWFLWTGEQSPAGRLYLKTGFGVTRRFRIMRAEAAGPRPGADAGTGIDAGAGADRKELS